MNKVMRIGTLPAYGGRTMSIYVRAQFNEGRLSLTGVEGPLASGDALGSCGQIIMGLREPDGMEDFKPAPGWTIESVGRLLDIWDRWHLNDMRAGSRAQADWLRNNPVAFKYPESHYEKASEALAAAGLNPDADGYRYGSAWKREDVPPEVLAELEAFPDADRQPAWI